MNTIEWTILCVLFAALSFLVGYRLGHLHGYWDRKDADA